MDDNSKTVERSEEVVTTSEEQALDVSPECSNDCEMKVVEAEVIPVAGERNENEPEPSDLVKKKSFGGPETETGDNKTDDSLVALEVEEQAEADTEQATNELEKKAIAPGEDVILEPVTDHESEDEGDTAAKVEYESNEVAQTEAIPESVTETKSDSEPELPSELEPESVPETPEERLQRIKEFYDNEFSRPDFESRGPKNSYVILQYDNYQRPQEHIQKSSKKRVEINEGNAKIAEYFGEELNSDEEFDLLIKQCSDNLTEASEQQEKSELNEKDEFELGKGDTFVNKGIDSQFAANQSTPQLQAIIEEEETQQEPASQSKKEKSRAEKRKKANDLTSTKVHLRHLPQNMKKEEFLESIGPLPEYNYLHFTSGSFMSRICSRKCTGFCHINFLKQEDADAFVSNYRIFICRDEKGEEHLGSTEFAINQRIPKNPSVIAADMKALYDMPKDPKFADFQKNYDASVSGVFGVQVNQDGAVTADIMINEIEERNCQKNELQTTPLLAYILAQANADKDKKFGNALKKASEKSRITIKKERKRDRRDRERRERRDKGEKEKEKSKSTKEIECDSKESGKQIEKKTRVRNSEKSRKSDSGTNQLRGGDSTKDKEIRHPGKLVESKSTGEDLKSSASAHPHTPGKERIDIDNKKERDRKSATGNKKMERRSNEKRSSNTRSERVSKSDTPNNMENKDSNGKSHEISAKTPDVVANKGPAASTENIDKPGTESDKPAVKKKTVKKIVKVKKIIKKSENGANGVSTVVIEKREVCNVNKVSDSQPAPTKTSKSVDNSKSKDSTSTSTPPDNNGSNSQVESKRTKKARPDMQIYRPGSLRSSKLNDSKSGSGDIGPRKERGSEGKSASSKSGDNKTSSNSKENSKQGDS